jgi:integrase
MPQRSKGARLQVKPGYIGADGGEREAVWIIRDGARRISTGCSVANRLEAEKALTRYLAEKHGEPSRDRNHSPVEILVTEVLNIYLEDVAPDHARPDETKIRVLKLGDFFERYTLADINGKLCRDYSKWRTGQTWKSATRSKRPRRVTEAAARRELEDLRAAINYHRREGYHREVIEVVLPAKSQSRQVWLTRDEAARLIMTAWRAKQVMRDNVTQRAVGKHIARFILVAVYTGTRHAAICGAAFHPAIGRGHVDLERGVFHRLGRGQRETAKRQPPVRLPERLLAHLRRWHRLGIAKHAVIEWNGRSMKSARRAFTTAVRAAGLPTTGPDRITPHVLRHTAATWAMQAGGDLWQIAKFLGMTVEMLERVYGHHHPDYQVEAGEAVTSKPRRAMNKRMTA